MRKKPLPEVTLVRVILIILLVMYHSFLPWVDDWGPRSFGRNTVYFWIAKASYSFVSVRNLGHSEF